MQLVRIDDRYVNLEIARAMHVDEAAPSVRIAFGPDLSRDVELVGPEAARLIDWMKGSGVYATAPPSDSPAG